MGCSERAQLGGSDEHQRPQRGLVHEREHHARQNEERQDDADPACSVRMGASSRRSMAAPHSLPSIRALRAFQNRRAHLHAQHDEIGVTHIPTSNSTELPCQLKIGRQMFPVPGPDRMRARSPPRGTPEKAVRRAGRSRGRYFRRPKMSTKAAVVNPPAASATPQATSNAIRSPRVVVIQIGHRARRRACG